MSPFAMLLTVAMTGVCAAGTALADPTYKASDIVSHFSAPALGASRALCIGTESECAKNVAAAPKPAASNFDLVINFEYNSDTLTKQARDNLDEFAKALKDPTLVSSSFVIEGHTDGMGSDDFNLDLSVRRSRAVLKYLEAKGVPAGRLEAKGYGKQRLLVNDPRSASNRRVETRLRTQ